MNSSRKYIVGGSAVVLLALSLRMLVDSASRDSSIAEPVDSQPVTDATPSRVHVNDGSAHAGQTERLDEDWDRLARIDRIKLATDEFDRAMIALELDRTDAVACEQARRALTSLRPEMFADQAIAEHYLQLERRFEALAE